MVKRAKSPDRVAALVAAAAALATAGLGLATNLASDLIPESLGADRPWLVWSVAGVMLLASVLLAAAGVRRPATDATGREAHGDVPAEGGVAGAGAAVSGAAINVASGGVGIQVVHSPRPGVRREGQVVSGEIPGRADPFVARDELRRLEQALADGERAVVYALVGGRGVGKTQLAAQAACWAIGRGWPLVAWVNGETEESLIAGLARLAHELGVPDPEGDAAASAARLRTELQSRAEPGLLVVDNASTRHRFARFLPTTGGVRVVVTSTEAGILPHAQRFDVGVFDRASSVAYLQERAGRDDPAGAALVAEEVGDSPLGLSRSAAVLAARPGLSFTEFARRLREEPLARNLPPQRGEGYPRGVAEAILSSVEVALSETRPRDGAAAVAAQVDRGLLARLLQTISVLAPSGISVAFLLDLAVRGGWPPIEADGDPPPRILEDALAVLAGASLVEWSEDGTSVLMHRLVAHALRDQAGSGLPGILTEVGSALTAVLPRGQEPWAVRESSAELVEHARHLLRLADAQTLASLGELGRWLVQHLTAIADHRRAVAIGQEMHSAVVQVLGGEHPDTLAAGNALAQAHASAGDLNQAERLFQQVLAGRERALGPSHPDTIMTRSNLGGIYLGLRRPKRAIPLLAQVAAQRRSVLGEEHPLTLAAEGNLAQAYAAADDLPRAITMLEAALARNEQVLGADDPLTQTVRNNLANVCAAAGDSARAITLLEDGLARSERTLGADHADTLTLRANLATACLSAGDPGRAVRLLEATLADTERALGSDHQDTHRARENLATARRLARLARQGRPRR